LYKHGREQFYNIEGNHDASGPDEPCQWWFRKWVDPLGENTHYSGVDATKRPYPIEGTWERYSFRVGNLLFLMMSDRNDAGPPIGVVKRGDFQLGRLVVKPLIGGKRRLRKIRKPLSYLRIITC